jgi:hypothetical protein
MKLQKHLAAALALTTLTGLGALPLTASALANKVTPTATIKTLPLVAVQAQKYRIDMFLEITGANDGPLDNVLEVYGESRVNNNQVATISRGNAKSREAGQTLNLGSYETTETNVSIFANVNDKDALSADDPVFRIGNNGNINLPVFLGGQTSREKIVNYSSGGGEASRLRIRVTKI